ncbi:MAG: PKD domain-containing protein [Fimbriimonadaceae bacterium]|nr:PKD domain-containing protein [Chitinophagales bacterium]
MKNFILLISAMLFSATLFSQGICDATGNIIIYSNYDGGDLQINIDEDVPNIKIGLCSYESWNITITGAYVDNVVEVIYAGYDDDGTTSITGVDMGIVDINVIVPVTLDDPDGYPYMICAYECDTDYIPGGCNTVDQLTDYFLTTFTGTFRYSYLQYGVFDEDEYYISEGGNCCFDGTASAAPIDVAITAITSPVGGCNMTSSEEVTVTIQNNGPGSIDAIPVNLSVDAAPPVTETAFITLEEGESGSYTFSETGDFSTTGLHSINVYSSLASDPDASNNNYDINVNSLESPEDNLAENITGCDEVILDAGNAGSIYSWSTGATSQTIVVTESGTYSVTTNLAGCTITESIAVTVNYFPIASFTYTPVGLTFTFTNTSTEGTSYLWNFGDGTTSTIVSPTHTYEETDTYSVTLTVTNDCGSDVYTTVITFDKIDEEDILFANTQIYPNPASANAVIDFNLDKTYAVYIRVLNITGEEMMIKNIGNIQTGKIELDLSSLQSGIYNVEITAGEKSIIRQLTLVR